MRCLKDATNLVLLLPALPKMITWLILAKNELLKRYQLDKIL